MLIHSTCNKYSGGQILRRLTRTALGLDKNPIASTAGTAVYEFPAPAAELKERLRKIVDGMEAQGAWVGACICD